MNNLHYSAPSNWRPRVMCFFVEGDRGHSIINEEAVLQKESILLAVETPYYIIGHHSERIIDFTGEQKNIVDNQTMKNFIGLEEASPIVIAAMIDFSFYLRSKDIDKAFEAIMTINSTDVWFNLTPICINMRRLDLVELCLKKMKSHRGLEAINDSKNEPEVEAKLASVAAALEIYDMAEELYTSCSRFDLLNKLYQRRGQWEKALQIAESKDRVHLELTRYLYSKHLVETGCVEMAEQMFGPYFNSTKSPMIVKLLKEKRFGLELEDYIAGRSDEELARKYGEYCESVGDFGKAKDYYDLSGNALSAVKLTCSTGNFERARLIVEESGDGAAAYYLAKFSIGEEAVKLLSMGDMTYQAIRIATSRGDCDEELFEIAQKCRGLPQIYDCARYFERKGMHEQACALFMRCNTNEQALSMCLCVLEKRGANSTTMNTFISLVARLKEKLSADVKHRIIDKLYELGEELMMVDVICTFAIVNKRLQLIFDKNVILTEAMVEMIFKGGTENKDQIRIVAIKCIEQGNHLLASKLYTMIGEKKNGIKCLIKHGNTKDIISYANCSKDKDIYVLAGNYFQKL